MSRENLAGICCLATNSNLEEQPPLRQILGRTAQWVGSGLAFAGIVLGGYAHFAEAPENENNVNVRAIGLAGWGLMALGTFSSVAGTLIVGPCHPRRYTVTEE